MPWPHIDTREDYERFVRAFARGTEGFEIACPVPYYCHRYECDDASCPAGSGFDFETFEPEPIEVECPYCYAPTRIVALDLEGNYDAGFSWDPCQICDRQLGGERQHFALVDKAFQSTYVRTCPDCVYFAEYGRLDDFGMLGG